jgi:large subunit ribosomal protein L22
MEAIARTRYLRMSPRKVRQVVTLIKGKDVDEAYRILRFTHKRAATPVYDTLHSAVANMSNQTEDISGIYVEDLYVKKAYVEEGPTLRGRFRPRAMGRATRIRKRTSHITIVVAEREER